MTHEPKPSVGIFNVLATFTPRHQALIFAASTLALLLMPVVALNWMDSRATIAQPASEPVVWLPASGASGTVEARIPSSASRFTLAAAMPGQSGTYRLSIVDVADRALLSGPDQTPSRGLALGLRLGSMPAGVTFAVVEKKAENGAYSMVSRHPLMIEWR